MGRKVRFAILIPALLLAHHIDLRATPTVKHFLSAYQMFDRVVIFSGTTGGVAGGAS